MIVGRIENDDDKEENQKRREHSKYNPVLKQDLIDGITHSFPSQQIDLLLRDKKPPAAHLLYHV